MVPQPPESHPLPGVQPLQVADHQDCAGPAAAYHGGPLPLQHARLPSQEDAGRLNPCWEEEEGSGRRQTLAHQQDGRRNKVWSFHFVIHLLGRWANITVLTQVIKNYLNLQIHQKKVY